LRSLQTRHGLDIRTEVQEKLSNLPLPIKPLKEIGNALCIFKTQTGVVQTVFRGLPNLRCVVMGSFREVSSLKRTAQQVEQTACTYPARLVPPLLRFGKKNTIKMSHFQCP